jgi:CRISPR-associated endonuclease/helicase Cas3
MKDYLEKDAQSLKFQFATAANEFRLIDDSQQVAIVVDWKAEGSDSRHLIDQLRFAGPSRDLLRKLQRYTINLPKREFEKNQACFENVQEYWCLTATGSYDETRGFVGAEIDTDLFVQ